MRRRLRGDRYAPGCAECRFSTDATRVAHESLPHAPVLQEALAVTNMLLFASHPCSPLSLVHFSDCHPSKDYVAPCTAHGWADEALSALSRSLESGGVWAVERRVPSRVPSVRRWCNREVGIPMSGLLRLLPGTSVALDQPYLADTFRRVSLQRHNMERARCVTRDSLLCYITRRPRAVFTISRYQSGITTFFD